MWTDDDLEFIHKSFEISLTDLYVTTDRSSYYNTEQMGVVKNMNAIAMKAVPAMLHDK